MFFYIDFILLGVSFLCALALSRYISGKVDHLRTIPLFLGWFGITTNIMGMVGHLGEILFRAGQQLIAGTFVYNYHFYSLILMGVVFMGLSLLMLWQFRAWCLGYAQGKRHVMILAATLCVLSFPTFWFTPIGLLPTLSCIVSVVGMSMSRRKKLVKTTLPGASAMMEEGRFMVVK